MLFDQAAQFRVLGAQRSLCFGHDCLDSLYGLMAQLRLSHRAVCLTRSVISVPALAACLERYWSLSDVRVTEHYGGMGSATWFVGHRGERWVAKLVAPVAGNQFAGGLALAQRLDQAGIPSGAPFPAGDGRLAVDIGAGWLALLRWVPGAPLTGGTTAERELVGTTLAAVHEVLAGCDAGGAEQFHWVDPDAGYLSLRPWLRPALVAALDAFEAADPGGMTWGLLHADPAPDAFRLDQVSGRCGVIDWSYFLCGPLLYDLASAVLYVGGPSAGKDLIEAYLRRGTLMAAEVRAGMDAMLRFRWAVQANYFAWRIAENDMTGISGPAENEKGMEDARRALSAWSAGTLG
jgi:Ser/Thr protein kinase RdoA (MazF antagonist)